MKQHGTDDKSPRFRFNQQFGASNISKGAVLAVRPENCNINADRKLDLDRAL